MQLAPAVERERLRQIEELRVDRADRAGGGLRRWRGHPRDHIPASLRQAVDAAVYDPALPKWLHGGRPESHARSKAMAVTMAQMAKRASTTASTSRRCSMRAKR